jgi:hypothetical protein
MRTVFGSAIVAAMLGCGLGVASPACAQPRTTAPVAVTHPAVRDTLLRRDKARLAADVALSSEFEATNQIRPSTVAHANGVHADNAAWLTRMLQTYGWLGRRAVGGDGEEAADRLLRHDIQDTALIAVALPLAERAFHQGEARGEQVAWLTDWLARARGRPQMYGTAIQLPGGMTGGGPVVAPIADSARVDERRAALGLRPLHEWVKGLREIWSVGTRP